MIMIFFVTPGFFLLLIKQLWKKAKIKKFWWFQKKRFCVWKKMCHYMFTQTFAYFWEWIFAYFSADAYLFSRFLGFGIHSQFRNCLGWEKYFESDDSHGHYGHHHGCYHLGRYHGHHHSHYPCPHGHIQEEKNCCKRA